MISGSMQGMQVSYVPAALAGALFIGGTKSWGSADMIAQACRGCY